MNNLFLYCSTAHAYSMLNNYAVLSSDLMDDYLRGGNTAGYINNSFLFLTADKLDSSLRIQGIGGGYYPLTVELSGLEESGLKVIFVYNEDGKYQLSENFKDISEYAVSENCIGCFAYGHIPFAFVSKLVFENADDMGQFAMASPELWFDETMQTTWENPDYDAMDTCLFDFEQLKELGNRAEDILDQHTKDVMNKAIVTYLKAKASRYCFIGLTSKWIMEEKKLTGNVDSALIEYLDTVDEQKKYRQLANEKLSKIKEIFADVDISVLSCPDEAFTGEDSQAKLLQHIVEKAKKIDSIDRSNIGDICDACRNCTGNICSDSECGMVLDEITEFCTNEFTSLRIDKLIEDSKDYPVLRILISLCVSSSSSDKGRFYNACSILSQKEKRCAGYVYGMLKGMTAIDGRNKSNRALSDYIEKAESSKYLAKFELLNIAFPESSDRSHGVEPKFYLKMSMDNFKKMVSEIKDDKKLWALYRDNLTQEIPLNDVFKTEKPRKKKSDADTKSTKARRIKKVRFENPENLKKEIDDITEFSCDYPAVFRSKEFKEGLTEENYQTLHKNYCR